MEARLIPPVLIVTYCNASASLAPPFLFFLVDIEFIPFIVGFSLALFFDTGRPRRNPPLLFGFAPGLSL